MSLLDRETNKVVRGRANLSVNGVAHTDKRISKIINILAGNNSLDYVRDAVIDRYATYIAEEVSESGSSTESLVKGTAVDAATRTAVNEGFLEITSLHLLETICRSHANLFGESRYELHDTDDKELVTAVSDLRDRSGIEQRLSISDLFSVGIGSMPIAVSSVGNKISLDPLYPNHTYYCFPDYVLSGVDSRERAPDTSSIDELAVLAHTVSADSSGEHTYEAWIGESVDYPNGRHVIYQARDWTQIPGYGYGIDSSLETDTALDYTIDGTWESGVSRDRCANLLTLWQRESGVVGPEYPIFVLRGSQSLGLMPIANLSLVDVSTEYDIGASVLLGSAQESAQGKQVLETERNVPNAAKISQTIYGRTTVLYPGQELNQIGWSAGNSESAMKVLVDQMRLIADSYSVPGFLVAPDWSSFPSGAALLQAEHKLKRHRDKRIALNRPSLNRLWSVMRAMINISEGEVVIDDSVTERWIPSRFSFPLDTATEAQGIKAKLDAGIIDIFDAIAEVEGNGISNRESAYNYLQERQDLHDRAMTEGITLPGKPQSLASLARLTER